MPIIKVKDSFLSGEFEKTNTVSISFDPSYSSVNCRVFDGDFVAYPEEKYAFSVVSPGEAKIVFANEALAKGSYEIQLQKSVLIQDEMEYDIAVDLVTGEITAVV